MDRSRGREAGMRIFVTGATGVVGRRLVPLLLRAGHTVTALARSPAKRAAMERAGAAAVEVDLLDARAVCRALAGHDTVVNLATHMPRTTGQMFLPGAWRENDRLRRDGSAVLVDAALAAGVGRFVQESFAPIYPDCGSGWIHEEVPVVPARYNRTVADAERAAARFGRSGRVGVVLRFALFYGADARYLPDAVKLVRRGWAPLFGSPGAYVSSISHDDLAGAVAAALGARTGTYNVTDDEPVTRREYVDALAGALGVAPPRFLPPWTARLGGSLGRTLARSLRISNAKFRDETGWIPRYPSVREGWPAVVAELGEAAGR